MTVDVTDDELNWRFAGGQGYTIARAEIDRVRTVPHRWWAGYGIKYFGPNDGPTSSVVATPSK
jgi:hypothetical protein